MRARGIDETAQRYVLNSVRGFLEGKKNDRWIKGVILHSGLPKERTLSVLQPLRAYDNVDRAKFLFDWLDSTTW